MATAESRKILCNRLREPIYGASGVEGIALLIGTRQRLLQKVAW